MKVSNFMVDYIDFENGRVYAFPQGDFMDMWYFPNNSGTALYMDRIENGGLAGLLKVDEEWLNKLVESTENEVESFEMVD